jgi:hypothetical protein
MSEQIDEASRLDEMDGRESEGPNWSRFEADLRPEDRLVLLCCCRSDDDKTRQRLSEILDGPLDWMFLCHTCVGNNVVVPVAGRLAAEPRTPFHVRRLLAGLQARVQARATRTRDSFEAILPLLSSYRVILLRGISHQYTLYRGLQTRQIGDIDLLVEQPVAPSVSGRMCDHHHIPDEILMQARGISIEFHYDFNIWNGLRMARFPMHDLRQRSENIEVAHCPVGILSPEDDLIYLSFHNVCKGFVQLYRLLDLRELIRQHDIRWDSVLTRARQFRVSRAVWCNGYVLNLLFGNVVPERVILALQPRRLLRYLLLRCFSVSLMLHDPNPRLRTIHSSVRRNCLKQLLRVLVVVNGRNWHKLILAYPLGRFVAWYGALYRLPVVGMRLASLRSRWLRGFSRKGT